MATFSSSVLISLVAAVLCTSTEAGLATPFLSPVAAGYSFAGHLPVQGVLRSAYSQVVGRSYAPSFVPVASSLAYAAAPVAVPLATPLATPLAAPIVRSVATPLATPVAAPIVRSIPTVYAAAPQLVAGPVLKTVRPYVTPFAAVDSPLAYAVSGVAPVVPAVRAAVPAFAPSVLSPRLAPVPNVGVAPVPATSLPGVVEARAAPGPMAAPATPAFLTAFESPQGIRLVGGRSAFEVPTLTGVATNVDGARVAPDTPQGVPVGRSANPTPAASTPETFGVPQQTPFSAYGPPTGDVNSVVNP